MEDFEDDDNKPIDKDSSHNDDFEDDDNKPTDEDNLNSDDLNSISSEEDILKQIDRKLTLKYMKEVKTSRTYIFGLDNYIKNKNDRNDFVKSIKKTLGTSVVEKKDGDTTSYGFAGDHIKYIYEYIVKKNICPINEIKK